MHPDLQVNEFSIKRRFSGLMRLYGSEGAARIQAAHVVVIGLGGVGSWAAEAAARSGVGRLTFIDLDHISESNINRQVHAIDTTVGQAKVIAMRDRVLQINPVCQVNCIEEFVDEQNWPGLVSGLLDSDPALFAVIDACDQANAKTAVAAWAVTNKILSIAVGAAGGKRHPHRVDIDDISIVTHDPLLAKVRYRLRKEHGAPRHGKINMACVFSREAVSKPLTAPNVYMPSESKENTIFVPSSMTKQADGDLNCHGYGSVVSVTSTFGMCAASWVFNKIADVA